MYKELPLSKKKDVRPRTLTGNTDFEGRKFNGRSSSQERNDRGKVGK